MPAVPKSPRTKKILPIAKPKGAVRAKSGCYTCRIRRKKCDEKRINNSDDAPCETCYRLKLECLGFGAKRPDWLRETSRVSEIRDRIKAHLAAQGMIKGHAGSGSRTVVQEDILRLSDYREGDMTYPSGGSSSSSSSPRRADSVESDRPSGHLTLDPAMRYEHHLHPHLHHREYQSHYQHHDQYPVHSDIPSRSDSPCDTPMNSSVYDHHDPRDVMLYNRSTYDPIYQTPARRSGFSKGGLYEMRFEGLYTIDDDPLEESDSLKMPILYTPQDLIPFEFIHQSIRNYVNDVVNIQYLLGDKNLLPTMIWNAVETHPDSQEAVKLLSRAYYGRKANPAVPVLADYETKSSVDALRTSLTIRTEKRRFSADDAMAALHLISLYLFDGGGGEWHRFLELAVLYVKFILHDSRFHNNYSAALEAANPKDEFVVKTTIWFDVLASITTQEPPLLLDYIRELFKPNLSWVGRPPSYTMMSPMGCQNTVVWALAETSYLSYWKRTHETNGDLSLPALLRKVAYIDEYLEEGPLPERPQQNDDDWARYLTSEIFRTSTRLFLRTVESGDQPQVPEIKDAVNRVFRAINILPKNFATTQQSAIVRSTVFGIFICGALTDDPDQRRCLTLNLEQNVGTESGVGNCGMAATLLRRLWENRSRSNQPVRWRDILKDSKVLLV